MPYNAEISRANPTCFILLLDQSGSMNDRFGAVEMIQNKAQFLADVTNRTLHDLVLRCSSTEEVKNYYEIAIIGYGASVGSAFGGSLAGKDLISISEVANNPARLEDRMKKVPDGAGGLVEQKVKFPIWVDPQANGGTPMCEALKRARDILSSWLVSHKTAFPPTVLHITDGESTDGDPTEIGKSILGLSTSDGNVLICNCHVSAQTSGKVEYPNSDENLPDNYARTLFGFSSPIPSPFQQTATSLGVKLNEGARAFVFNADPVSLAQFFEIGTRPANLR